MNEEYTRDDLISLLKALGACDESTESADNDTLVAIAKNKILLVVDTARIEAALSNERLPIEWRSQLLMRKIDLAAAKRAVADAMVGRAPRRGDMVVRVPDNLTLSHFYGQDGRCTTVRLDESGHRVIDIFSDEWMTLIRGPDGQLWEASNAEAVRDHRVPHMIRLQQQGELR
jgi:hypothetical protein